MSSSSAPLLVVGAPSSGTSLLQKLLSRHPHIYAGYELSLLNKHAFYGERYPAFQTHFHRIIQRGCCTEGWQWYGDTLSRAAAYGWPRHELPTLAETSRDSRDFLARFYARPMEGCSAQFWAEKTPSNAYCVPEFLQLYPEGRILHMYRHPLDVMASLRRRGLYALNAAMAWIYGTSAALRGRTLEGTYVELCYENLVSRPEEELTRICCELGIPYEPDMLLPDTEEEQFRISSWEHSPMGRVSAASIGKHRHRLSDLDHYALQHCAVSRAHSEQYRMVSTTARELMEILGYERPDEQPYHPGLQIRLHQQEARNRIARYARYTMIDRHPRRPYPGRLLR